VRIITYSLKNNAQNSDSYYNDVSWLTNKVLFRAKEYLFPIIEKYIIFINKNNLEEIRTNEEYLFDLLNASTNCRIYYTQALHLTYPEYFILANLYKLRRKIKLFKPSIDWFRGIMGTYSLLRKNNVNENDFNSLKNFIKVIRWMEAAGEFREDVKRFKLLGKFLRSLSEKKRLLYLEYINQFTSWFESESNTILGPYTSNVDNYLLKNYKGHLWKEDVIFCGRQKLEYYLSMVGAELMNRAFYVSFKSTIRKAVLLPACMKLLPDIKCKAKKNSLDYICSRCSPNCKINQYSSFGLKNNFEVHIIPHSSYFTNWLRHFAVGSGIGVVGVACPLNLINGGLELKSLNIPTQCILLDYCGCKTHWDKDGFPTDINFNELKRTINITTKAKALTY
jgi:hypothetical protein